MKILKSVISITIIMGFCSFHGAHCNVNSTKQTIVLMRHGEKPLVDIFCSLGQLNCQGLNRALALPQVLHARFGKPDFLFAPNPVDTILDGCLQLNSYVRPLATIEPTAIQYGMPVNTPLGYNHFMAMADLLLSNQYRNSLIFVAWEHVNIYLMATTLIEKLGGNPTIVPIWHNDDYDSLYVLTIDWNNDQGTVIFTHEHEGLNEKSALCPNPEWIKTENESDTSHTKTIFIIPSAETSGFGQLNCTGLNRSLGLKNVLTSANSNVGLKIDYFFAAAPGLSLFPARESSWYQRSLMTLEPTAISQTKPLGILFNFNDSISMAAHIMKKTFQSSTIAIAWDPAQIQELATLIYTHSGGNSADIPFGEPDVDTIYKITIAQDATPTFQTFSEGLSPSPVCPLAIEDFVGIY